MTVKSDWLWRKQPVLNSEVCDGEEIKTWYWRKRLACAASRLCLLLFGSLVLAQVSTCVELPHFSNHFLHKFFHSFVLISREAEALQKKQKIKAVNCLTAGFSSTRHHLNGPFRLQVVINAYGRSSFERASDNKCCHSVAENTLFPSTNSRPVIGRR